MFLYFCIKIHFVEVQILCCISTCLCYVFLCVALFPCIVNAKSLQAHVEDAVERYGMHIKSSTCSDDTFLIVECTVATNIKIVHVICQRISADEYTCRIM